MGSQERRKQGSHQDLLSSSGMGGKRQGEVITNDLLLSWA